MACLRTHQSFWQKTKQCCARLQVFHFKLDRITMNHIHARFRWLTSINNYTPTQRDQRGSSTNNNDDGNDIDSDNDSDSDSASDSDNNTGLR